MFLGGVLKIYSKFTGEHPCRNGISIKLLRNFIEITFRHKGKRKKKGKFETKILLQIKLNEVLKNCKT